MPERVREFRAALAELMGVDKRLRRYDADFRQQEQGPGGSRAIPEEQRRLQRREYLDDITSRRRCAARLAASLPGFVATARQADVVPEHVQKIIDAHEGIVNSHVGHVASESPSAWLDLSAKRIFDELLKAVPKGKQKRRTIEQWQGDLLPLLKRDPNMSQEDLASELGVTPAAVSQAMRKEEIQRFCSAFRDNADGRVGIDRKRRNSQNSSRIAGHRMREEADEE